MVLKTDDRSDDASATDRSDRRTVLKALGAAGTVSLSALAGCTAADGGDGGDGGDSSGTTTGTTDDSIGTVNYGILNPMTGPYAALAEQQRAGARLGVEWVNESDEFDFQIEATYGDTQAETEAGQQAATQAIQQDDADFLMGAISSSVALGLNTIALDQEVLYNPGGAAIPITGSQCNEYVFRAETNTAQNARGSAVWTKENLGENIWFHIADYAYGRSVLNEWRNLLEPAGYNEVGVTRADLGSTNFDPFISEIMNSDADVVVVGSTGGDLVNFIRQAHSAGLKDQMDVMTTAGTFQSVRNGIGETGYGVYGGTRYVYQVETGDNQEFVSRFRDANEGNPDNFARVAFDSIRMTAHGIQEAGTNDPTEVKDVLPDLEVPSLFGPNNFRACDHQATNPIWIGRNVEPDEGETPDVELLEKREGADVIPPCEETGCEM